MTARIATGAGTLTGHWRTHQDNDSEYIGAWDLPRPVTVEIESVRSVVVPSRGKIKGGRKVVVTFKRARKGLLLNATNGKAIASMYGNDVAGWPGRSITIYATTTESREGTTVDAVRVRPTIPREAASALESQPVDAEMRERQRRGAGELPPSGEQTSAPAPPREPGEEG